MQADLKTLNLKKTFSFLQNLDYNEDEEGVTIHKKVVGHLPKIEDEFMKHNTIRHDYDEEEEEKGTQRMMDPR